MSAWRIFCCKTVSGTYRMLGSVADAEDMLQETFLRWQQTSDDPIRSPRAFLGILSVHALLSSRKLR